MGLPGNNARSRGKSPASVRTRRDILHGLATSGLAAAAFWATGGRAQPPGDRPRIDRFCVNVAFGEFDQGRVAGALAALGATVVSKASDPLLHFRSPEGIGVELRPVDPARMWGRV